MIIRGFTVLDSFAYVFYTLDVMGVFSTLVNGCFLYALIVKDSYWLLLFGFITSVIR